MAGDAVTSNQFRNAILLLKCIDADEFAEAILIPSNKFMTSAHMWEASATIALWSAFQKDPVKFYIHTSGAHRNALWAIIEKRLTTGENND